MSVRKDIIIIHMKKYKKLKKRDYKNKYLELEEIFLTNHRNKDKILRKLNKW